MRPIHSWHPACVVLLALTGTAAAQQPVAAAGTGIVTGHAVAGDTQAPARFASVALFGIPADVTTQPKLDPNADPKAQAAAVQAALSAMSNTNMVQATTATDGSFTATDVPPGDYYLFATSSGYVSPVNQIKAAIAAGADPKKPLPGVPTVHVVADRTANADVTLQRGAAISGTIRWDDGSPVTGAIMTVVPGKGGDTQPPTQFAMLAMVGMLSTISISDDLGHYRIAGLPPGDYIVKATLQTGAVASIGASMNLSRMMAATPLVLFSPAAFHKADAKPITVTAGEDLRDQAMTLNLGGLHTVSGQVLAADDHHGINQATVRLTDSSDKDFVRGASVDAQGHYTVTFLPPGTYSLTVTSAADTEAPTKEAKKKAGLFGAQPTDVRQYKNGKSTVVVADADLTGQDVELAVDKDPKTSDSVEQILNGLAGGSDSSNNTKPQP